MAKRVYFVGAQSTGKTTLAEFIANYLGWRLIKEQAREVIRDFCRLEYPLAEIRKNLYKAEDFQREILKRQIAAEDEAVGDYVSDRAFDNIVYAAHYTIASADIKNTLEFQSYLSGLRSSDAIIFFIRPHESLLAIDNVRTDADWKDVCQIDGMIEYILESERIPYIPLESPSMKSRVRTVLGVLHAAGVPNV